VASYCVQLGCRDVNFPLYNQISSPSPLFSPCFREQPLLHDASPKKKSQDGQRINLMGLGMVFFLLLLTFSINILEAFAPSFPGVGFRLSIVSL